MSGCCGGGEVWIDPAELDRTASLLVEQAGRIQEATAGATACGCGSPSTGLAWVDEALAAATAEAQRVAAAYVVESADLSHRAAEVVVEEATATTTVDTTTVTPTAGAVTGTVVPVGAATGFQTLQPGDMGYLGGLEGLAAFATAATRATGLTPGPGGTIDPQGRYQGGLNDGLGGMDDLLKAVQAQGNVAGSMLAPSGTTVNAGGLYEDGAGHTGTISHVEPDPSDPITHDVRP